MLTLIKPEFLIANARKKFVDGRLVDEDTRTLIKELLEKISEWISRLKLYASGN